MEPNKQENQNNLSGGIFSNSGGLFGNIKFNPVSNESKDNSKLFQLSGKEMLADSKEKIDKSPNPLALFAKNQNTSLFGPSNSMNNFGGMTAGLFGSKIEKPTIDQKSEITDKKQESSSIFGGIANTSNQSPFGQNGLSNFSGGNETSIKMDKIRNNNETDKKEGIFGGIKTGGLFGGNTFNPTPASSANISPGGLFGGISGGIFDKTKATDEKAKAEGQKNEGLFNFNNQEKKELFAPPSHTSKLFEGTSQKVNDSKETSVDKVGSLFVNPGPITAGMENKTIFSRNDLGQNYFGGNNSTINPTKTPEFKPQDSANSLNSSMEKGNIFTTNIPQEKLIETPSNQISLFSQNQEEQPKKNLIINETKQEINKETETVTVNKGLFSGIGSSFQKEPEKITSTTPLFSNQNTPSFTQFNQSVEKNSQPSSFEFSNKESKEILDKVPIAPTSQPLFGNNFEIKTSNEKTQEIKPQFGNFKLSQDTPQEKPTEKGLFSNNPKESEKQKPLIDEVKPQAPQIVSFKPTLESDVKNVQLDKQFPKLSERERTPSFEIGKGKEEIKQTSSQFMNKSNLLENKNQSNENFFKLHKLCEIMTLKNEKVIEENCEKICNSFKKYIGISTEKNIIYCAIKFVEEIAVDEGINKLLNDFTLAISQLYKCPKENYREIGELFHRMIIDEKIVDRICDGNKINQNFILNNQIYKVNEVGALVFQWESGVASGIIAQFIRYFSILTSRCLKDFHDLVKIFKKTSIYEHFLETDLLINERFPQTENQLIIQSMKANDQKLMSHLNRILNNLCSNWYSKNHTIEIISPKAIISFITLVDNLPACPSTKIFQRLLLKNLHLSKHESVKNKELIQRIEKTTCKILLPFRVILHRLDKTKKKLDPFHKELFEQIDGPEWTDWLSLYLGEDNLRLKEKETQYLIKALKAMKISNIDKIISKESQIKRLIHIMSQEGQVKNFYQTLSTIIYSEDSIKKCESEFFNETRHLTEDLKMLANEIRKFPNCEFQDEDIPDLYGKSIYFLTTLVLQPERAFQYENALFDMMGFMDMESERCDRICHLVIDILAYFTSRQFDEEIIVKCFDSIVSLFSNSLTKECMSLAMNVNRPQFDFFNKNLPKSILDRVYFFLTNLISSEEFYDSIRIPDQTTALSRAFPFRYIIEKYLVLIGNTQQTIPLYWFSNCLKMSIKQAYNPEIIEMILSKLVINGSKIHHVEVPYLFMEIVEACNASGFWKDFNNSLAASGIVLEGKFGIYNKQIVAQQDSTSFSNVFFSLKLLKTMLELRKCLLHTKKIMPKHFICQLLSSLNCLSEVERFYFQGGNDLEFSQSKVVPPLVSLLSLICEDSDFFNTSSFVKTEWLFSENSDVNIEEIKKLHSKTAQNIDYSIVRDVLAHPFNQELDSFENISSIAFSCLSEILSEKKEISVEGILFSCIPKSNLSKNVPNYESLKNQITDYFIKALNSYAPTLSRNAWKLLIVLRGNPLNKKIANEIFKEYKIKNMIGLEKGLNLKYVSEYLLIEVKEQNYSHSELISELLETVCGSGILNIQESIQVYQKKSVFIETLHQFERLMIERKMVIINESYQILSNLIQIVLMELYAGIKCSTFFTNHSSLIIKILADNQVLNIAVNEQYNDEFIACQNIPRLYGIDILESYLIEESKTREQLIEKQVQNVIKFFKNGMLHLHEHVKTFLSVILSIDETYYSNHEVKVRSKKHSELFCQLHMGVLPYRAEEILGQSERESFNNAKSLVESCLTRIDELKRLGVSNLIIETYVTIDLLLGWMINSKNAISRRNENLMLCKRVFSICFSWIGGPILEPVATKLLLTCVNYLKNDINEDHAFKIKQTIIKTVESVFSTSSDIKQELLTLLLIVPIDKNDIGLMEMVTKLWQFEENNEYFYTESRIMMRLCSLYPTEMSKLKILQKCERISRIQDSSQQGIRYRDGLRTNENKCWVWILKIVTSLMENGYESTIVVHEVVKFVQNNKKRLFFTFNEPKEFLNNKNKSRDISLEISLAQLDEMEASLELFIVLSQSKIWVEMNRSLFEEMVYFLMHRTIILFAPESMSEKLRKKYIPYSVNEKILWRMSPNRLGSHFHDELESERIIEEISQFSDSTFSKPSVFILAMSIRYNECLKLWLLACSNGMRNSCFVKEYFNKPISIDANSTTLKYSLTHWDHLNKAIIEIINALINRIKDWGKWEMRADLLNLLVDSFNSAELFTETGYLSSTIKLPGSEENLIIELGNSLSLALEMGACHLVCQIYFRNKNGTFSKENLQNFQEKLLKLSALAEEKLVKQNLEKNDEMFETIMAGKGYVEEIQV